MDGVADARRRRALAVNWLERYLAGEHEVVWDEMTNIGHELADRKADHQMARAVAAETMQRARRNVERLIEMLPTIGYQFTEAELLVPPSPHVIGELATLEARIGAMPLSLRAWYEEVGEVVLVGTHPDWDLEYDDALEVRAPGYWVLSEFEEWERRPEEERRPYFYIELAADFISKAGYGGGTYMMEVPDPGADGWFLEERHDTTFVDYLRIAFRWGGLPGWDPGLCEGWRIAGADQARRALVEIAAQLEPI